MPIINGTPGNDALEGTDGPDEIYGFDGNDTINGRFGADRLFGGAGNDLFLFTGVSVTYPSPPIGAIDGGSGVDTIDARAISPTYLSYSAGSGLNFTAGNQAFNVSNVEIFRLGRGADEVSFLGSPGALTIYLGAGNDRLLGSGGLTVFGEEGDDWVFSTGGIVADGGTGIDTFQSGGTIDLAAGSANWSGGLSTLLNFENILAVINHGESATAYGDASANRLEATNYAGAAGRAFLYGRGGNDTLIGGSNADLLSGGADDDRLEGRAGADALYGDDGNDTLLGGAGDDLIDGGAGIDTASFEDCQSAGVIANLATGAAVGSESGLDKLVGIENLRGSDFEDQLTGDNNANRLEGRAGSDVLRAGGGDDLLDGGSGADQLYGDEGNDVLIGGAGDDLIDGGAGTDTAVFSTDFNKVTITNENGQIVVTGPDGRDVVRNVEVLQFADGIVDVGADGRAAAQMRQSLVGSAGADILTGGGSNDTLSGLAGNDLLRGGGGSDVLNGGSGVDAAIYAGLRLQYAASSTAVSGGPEGGTDTLISIEEARFVDGVLSFDVDGVAAQVMRLYDAALDRSPDQGGLESLTQSVLSGATTIQQLASAFLNSPEFQARYGALSNQAFIEQIYRFSLDREGDPAGIAAWTANLNGGMARDTVLLLFSESAEHRTLTAGAVAAGIWLPDAEALAIARLYDTTFERLPDAAGLASWTGVLESGRPLLEIAAAFAGSAEFQTRYGALSNQAFVEQIYRASLDREGDAPGIAAWVNQLDQGASRASILLAFSESAEHVALTAPLWSGGIQYAGYVAHASAEAFNEATVSTSPALHPSDFDAIPEVDAYDTGSPAMTSAETIVRVGSDFATDGIHHALFLPMGDEFVTIALPSRDASGVFVPEAGHELEQVAAVVEAPQSEILLPEPFMLDGLMTHPHQPHTDYWLN